MSAQLSSNNQTKHLSQINLLRKIGYKISQYSVTQTALSELSTE